METDFKPIGLFNMFFSHSLRKAFNLDFIVISVQLIDFKGRDGDAAR